MVWLAARNRLSTRKRLFGAGVVADPSCVLCGVEEEFVEHLLFACAFGSEVLDRVCDWLRMSHKESSLGAWLTWFGNDPGQSSPMLKIKLLAFTGLVYYIWRARNLKIFEGEEWSAAVCARRIILDCRARIGANFSSWARNRREASWIRSLLACPKIGRG